MKNTVEWDELYVWTGCAAALHTETTTLHLTLSQMHWHHCGILGLKRS